jgi:hypothetical protein
MIFPIARNFSGFVFVLHAFGLTSGGCNRHRPLEEKPASSASAATSAGPALSSTAQPAGSADRRPEFKWYGWIGDSSRSGIEATDTALDRFGNSLPGYSVAFAELGSWAEWLRLLPLAAPGTPVKNYRGEIVVPGDDEHLAAVVAIDTGTGDNQQSADIILRLHAEWRWFNEDFRMLYLAESKLELPVQKWSAGERLVSAGGKLKWVLQQAPQPKLDHAEFRAYLDSVFAWSDSRALLAESDALAPEKLEPGAFFLHAGHPSEVLIVLDVATSPKGDRALLLAQALNQAQSLHVIRPSRDTLWFPVRTDQPLQVPRVRPYSWKELRRMKLMLSAPEVACTGSLCPKAPQPSRAHGR